MTTTSMNMLQRKPVNIPNTVEVAMETDRKELLAKARIMLGHDVNAKHEVEIYRNANTLREAQSAFTAIGIEPYTKESVHAYQKSVIQDMNRKFAVRNFVNSFWGEMVMHMCGWTGIVGTVFTTGTIAVKHDNVVNDLHTAFHLSNTMMAVQIFFGLLMVTWWTIAGIRNATGRRTIGHDWLRRQINDYHKLVPEFALAHAVALKEILPFAGFHVEYLNSKQIRNESIFPDTDPFLVMVLGNYHFYIDAWDESAFENRKVA